MLSKKNHKLRKEKSGEKVYRYGIKKLSVGVASVAIAAGIIFASDVQLAQAAGTVDAVNGTLEITPEQQAEVTAIHEANQVATPTMATTTDPVTGQNIPADGGVAQMIETSKELRIKNPELAKELEAQSDNGPSGAAVSTEPAPTEPALTAPAKVENAERTEGSTVYTGKPVDSNLLNTALDAKDPNSVKKEENITGYGVNLSDFSKAGNEGNTVFEIKNTAFHPTVPPVDRYEVRYEIDDRIARYVEDIRYIARDSDKTSDRDFSMTRLNDVTDPAKVSNTWKMNAYDVNIVTTSNDPQAWNNYDSMFASSQTGLNKNATLQVKLKDTWENILKEFPEAKENNELFFNAYLYDPVEDKVIDGSINKTFFKTKPTALDKLQNAGYAREVPGDFGFTNGQAQYVEGGTVDPYTGQYDPNAKVRGIAVDQSFSKLTAGEVVSEPSTYHFQADERLVPYIKGVGIYRPKRDARAFDRDLHAYEQVFYNGLILNDDQSGINSTLPIAKPNERLKGNADQYYMDYDPKTGSGHFKVDPDTSGTLASGNRQMNKAGGDGASLAGVRVVYFIKDDVNIDQLRPASLDQNYAFTGYFLDQKGNYLANTEGNISYNFGDFKGDPSPITNKGNPGVEHRTRTNPKDQELPEVKTPTYIAQAEPKTVLLNTKVTAEDLIKAQAVDADGQPVDFPEGTVFQFVKVDAEGKFVEDLKDENGKDLKALDTSQVGLQEVNIRVTLPRQSTSRIISGLVQVNKRPGESGQKLSEEQFIPMTNSGSRNEFNSEGFLNNVIHQMETKLTPESQAENEIDVTVSSLIHLIPSESEDTLKKWDYVIEFSDNVAKHIVSIENSKGGEFERIVNRNGDLTNSWKMRAWGGDADSRSLMTNTEIGAGNNYPVKVTLDTSVTAVLDEVKADLGREVTNGDIDSTAYVYNNAEKAIVDGSYSSTFLKVQPTEYDAKEATDKPVWNNWFELSSGRVKYFEGNSISPYTGLTGDKVRGFAVDQFFNKSGGSSLNTIGATTDPVHYHYTVDKRLIPYLESASLYYIPNGEDNYNNSAVGKDFSYIPQAQVFFNGQDHQWDEFRNEFDPTTGQGTFKLDPDNGTIARLINFDNSHLDPGAARIVYTLRDGVTLNDILKDNPDATYAFTGYLTLDSGPKVRNSNANIGYTISDINGDGIADEWQNVQYKDLSDHEKAILTPIEAALVNKGLTGTNANVLVTEARANDNSVEGLLNVGYNEGEVRTVVVETVNETGNVVKLGEAAVDPITGKFTINFTDPNTKLVEGQELLLSVVNEGKTVAANVQTVKAPDQIVKSYNNVVDLVQPTPESQEVAAGKAIQNVQLETFTELADADKPADVTIPAYDGTTDTNILKFVSYTQKGVTGDPTTDVAEAKQATLPAGLSIVDGVLQGTPEITDWAEGETERVLTFVEDATNDKEGNATDRTFTITVKRPDISKLVDPRYENTETKPGVEVKTDEPTFVEEGTETPATKPEGTKFETGTNVPTDKGDITIDENTGVVTYKPGTDVDKDKPEVIVIPVKVTYPDETFDETTVKITVAEDVYDRGDNDDGSGGDKHPVPEGYYRVTVQPDEHLQFKDKADKKRQVYDVKKVVKDETGQEKPGTVDVSGLVFEAKAGEENNYKPLLDENDKQVYNPAVSNQEITAAGTYTAKQEETDAKKYPPTARELVKQKGDAPTEQEVTGQVSVPNYPTELIDRLVVTVDNQNDIPNGQTSVDKHPVPTTVTYHDKSTAKIDVPVTIRDGAIPHNETYAPSYTPVETTLNTEVKVEKPSFKKNGVDVPEGETIPLADPASGTHPFQVTPPAEGTIRDVQPDGSFHFTPTKPGLGETNPEPVLIDVLVTYDDGTFETTQAKVIVGKDVYERGDEVPTTPVPDGYTRVKFDPTANAKLEGTKEDNSPYETTKPVYFDVKKGKGLGDKVPTVKPNPGFMVQDPVWDPEVPATYDLVPGQRNNEITHTAQLIETNYADNLDPKYEDKETKPGLKVKTDEPDFFKEGTTTLADKPEGTKFEKGDNVPTDKGTIDIDENTGVVTYTPDEKTGKENPEKVVIPVKVNYPDQTSEETTVTITVAEDVYDRGDDKDEHGNDKHTPVPEGYYRVTVVPDAHLQFKDNVGKTRQVYDVKKVVKDETGQEKPGTVDVSGLAFEAKAEHKNDYKPELKDGKQVYDPAVTDLTISSGGTYIAKETETDAKKYTPEAKELVKEKGNKPTEEEITGQVTIPGYPEEADKPTISVKDPDDIPSGEEAVDKKPVPTEIEYPDGSKDELNVPVTIQETTPVSEKTEAEQHNPSYPDVEGKPGTTITIPNTGDKLPQGTTIEVTGPEGYVTEVVPGTETEDPKIKVTIPEASKPGEKVELKVEVTYPDGSKDTPTETLDKDGRPIEGAPANPGLTPEVTTDKGDSAEGKPGDTVPIKDEKDLPIGPGTKIEEKPGNDTGITIKDTPEGPQVVIPEGKKPGTYLVPVIITHDNGVIEETTIAVKVTPKPTTDSDKPTTTVEPADPAKPVTTPTETPAQEPTQTPEQETVQLTVNPVQEGDKVVTGTTEPGADLTVQFPGADPVQTVADGEGNFAVQVPEGVNLKAGDQVTVTASVQGKKSATQTVTVQGAKTTQTPEQETVQGAKATDSAKSDGKKADTLPETGESYALFSAAATSILAGLGLVAPRKREDD